MFEEENRLASFNNWPTSAAPRHLARDGFYYTGRGQEVKCFHCDVTISELNVGEHPSQRHQEVSPDCLFLQNPSETCNIPFCDSRTFHFPTSRRRLESDVTRGMAPGQRRDLNTIPKTYVERLQSFANWPKTNVVDPKSLALAGFHYTQRGDMVECVFCKGVMMRWQPGDNPHVEHRKHYPRCEFHRRSTDEEVLTGRLELENVKLMPGTTTDLEQLGIQAHSAPRQPKHATFEDRLRTFQGWPSNLRQTPEMLAIAGFYYAGLQDHVRCFHCGGGLRHWEETDDAWTEHARWFPKCGFVALIRGQEFIKQCVENQPTPSLSMLGGVRVDQQNGDAWSIPSLPTVSARSSPVHQVTDAELEEMLNSQPATAALEIGLHVGRVKLALKRRMETTGIPYSNADQLIEDATRIQLGEENNIQAPDSASPELSYLLNELINQASSSSQSIPSNSESEARLGMLEVQENGIADTATTSTNENSLRDHKKSSSKITRDEVSLEEENRTLKAARLCKICLDREVAVVFLPCGHLTSCVFCALLLTHCPVCRQEIRATVRTFLA